MFVRVASAVLGLALLAASPAHADRDRHRHHGHGHHQKWHGHQWHGHNHYRHHHHHGARIVIWQPAPVYRAYPAPYPVYVPPPAPVYAPIQAVPLRSYQDTSGRYCREYQRMADIGGQPQQVYGTACMMPDGSWQIVSE